MEPQQRDAHPTEDHGGSMNLPTSVEERVNVTWSVASCQLNQVTVNTTIRLSPHAQGLVAHSHTQAADYYTCLVWALNPKAEVGSFELACLRRNLEARQVPLTKRLLLKLGLTPSASQFESTRLVYGFCRLHGYYVDYPHGPDERYILCPKCLASTYPDVQACGSEKQNEN